MATRRQFMTGCAGALSLFVPVAPGELRAGETKVRLALVTAPDNPLNDVTMHQLKRLYRSEVVTGPSGAPLVPFAQPTASQDRIGFDRTVLGLTPEDVARFWIDRKIRGQPGPPKVVTSSEVLQHLVRSMAGSLGYVRAGDVRASVKVLRVNGRAPDDSAYPLVY